jgi:hypothetical protein
LVGWLVGGVANRLEVSYKKQEIRPTLLRFQLRGACSLFQFQRRRKRQTWQKMYVGVFQFEKKKVLRQKNYIDKFDKNSML